MIISKKKFTALIEKEKTKAFVEGYEKGVRTGKRDMLTKRITPNDIRQAFGFPPFGSTPISKQMNEVLTKLEERMEVKE